MGRFISLLLGYVFGNFLTAEIVSRRISGCLHNRTDWSID